MIPPPQSFLQEPNARSRPGLVRELMTPGADQALARHLQSFEQSGDSVGVAVRPTPNRVNRALDRRVVFAHRSVLPVAVAPLMLEPIDDPRADHIQSLAPQVAPTVAHKPRIGWPRRAAEHDKSPRRVFRQQTTALVVNI